MNLLFCVVLLVSLIGLVYSLNQCTDADKRYMFTPCDENGEMEAVEYFSQHCDTTGVVLSKPRSTPCVEWCPSGTWYSPQSLKCDPCQPGSWSNSGGKIINDFHTFPDNFATYCDPQPCSPWAPSMDGVSISSGNQSANGQRMSKSLYYSGPDDTVWSSLVTIVDIINPNGGKLFFSYRTESEKGFDGLIVKLNGTIIEKKGSVLFASGLQHSWRDADPLPLPVGRAQISFIFVKDRNQDSTDGAFVGSDRAFIKDIVIEGVQFYAPQCSPCRAGQFTDLSGSMSCKTCNKNNVSNFGAATCTPCGTTSWAPPGSQDCILKKPCAAHDYVAEYGPCDAQTSKRPRTWKLVSTRCNAQSGVQLTAGVVDCAGCLPGFRLNPDNHTCEPCPAGKYLQMPGMCAMCAPGSAAIPITSYKGFDTFGGSIPASFKPNCSGLCSECPEGNAWCNVEAGFDLQPFPVAEGSDDTVVGIRQSLANGEFFESSIRYEFTAAGEGHVEIEYMFYPPHGQDTVIPSQLSASFGVDGQDTALDKYYVGPLLRGKMKQYFKAGPHTLRWQVSQDGSYAAAGDGIAVVLLGIEIVADLKGSADKCSKCTAGHFCQGGTNSFEPCRPGTAQNIFGQHECNACTGRSVAVGEGNNNCLKCSPGSVATSTHDECENLCKVTLDLTYDISGLRNHVFGPMFAPGGTAANTSAADAANLDRFYVSPCSYVNADVSKAPCLVKDNEPSPKAYSCERVNANLTRNLGTSVFYSAAMGNLVQQIGWGETCPSRPHSHRMTSIKYLCDAALPSPGTMEFVDEQPACQFNFVHRGLDGCPTCTELAFRRTETACDSMFGVKTVQYYKLKDCVGGYEPPAPKNVSCNVCTVNSYEAIWSDCVNGHKHQVLLLKEEAEGCLELSWMRKMFGKDLKKNVRCAVVDASLGKNGFTVAISVVLALMLVLGGSLVCLFQRHSNLKTRYQSLSSNANEMADVVADSEDDVIHLEDHNESVLEQQRNAGAQAAKQSLD